MKYRFLAAVMGVMLTFSATGTAAVVAQAQTEQSQGEKPDGEPPEKPNGESGQEPPEKPSDDTNQKESSKNATSDTNEND